jgi:hypothetical protein
LLTGADRTSFNANEIKITGETTVGVYVYEFVVIDAANKSAKLTKTVTVEQAIPPTITYNGTDERTSALNSFVAFNFTGVKGTAKITTLEVKQNDLTITDFSRIDVDGTAAISNPVALGSAFLDGFTMKSILVKSPNTAGSYKYTFIFGDETGNKVSKDIIVKVGSALTLNKPQFLFNADGPFNGALDLDTGENVSSSSTESEIQDLGIDASLPAASNWIQKIKAENGAALRQIIKGDNVEITFDFSKIEFKEELSSLWSKGKDINESPKVEPLQIYVVKKGDKYYGFEVIKVNSAPSDNTDSYELSIKH